MILYKKMKSSIFNKKLFGGEIRIEVYGYNESQTLESIIEQMYQEALRLQKIFNFFDPDSELSKLNKNGELKVSPEMLKVIKKSLEFSEITDGNYDIALGAWIAQRKNKQPETKTRNSYKDIEINSDKITLKNNVAIDLGSIAKGYITDKLGEFLKEKGIKEFLIDSRGDILVSGDYSHILGVQDPRDKEKSLFSINITDQAVATSGDYEQFYGDFEKSHIINKKDVIAATIIADNLEIADVIATSLMVSDKQTRERIMKKYGKAKAFIVTKNSEEYYNNFEDIIK